jgi:type IV pilus assembly protein PilA
MAWSTLKKLTVLWAVVVAGVAILFLGAIAAPKYGRFGRAKQNEARQNLKSIYTGMRSYYQEKDTYLADAREIGFQPERGNRYAYFLAPGGPVERRNAQASATPAAAAGVTAVGNDVFKTGGVEVTSAAQTGCKVTPGKDEEGREITLGVTPGLKGGFVALAARVGEESITGKQGAFECWSVASMERTARSGSKIPAGVPYNETEGTW